MNRITICLLLFGLMSLLGLNAPAGAQTPPLIRVTHDIPYRAGDPDARMDIYTPVVTSRLTDQLPTVVWAHGGGWVYGHKGLLDFYHRMLSQAGFTVVALDYSLAPVHRYPTPVVQINTALAYLKHHAKTYHVDPTRLFLAGESAGAQLMGQVANLHTNPLYAKQLTITPGFSPYRFRGVALFSGSYEPSEFPTESQFGILLSESVKAYLGNVPSKAGLKQLSVREHLTSRFPPMFITVGNSDELAPQSYKLWARANSKGVPTDAMFFSVYYFPPTVHNYAFEMHTAEARWAFCRLVTFLHRYS